MFVVLRFRGGVTLKRTADRKRLFVCRPYYGQEEVKAGDIVRHALGRYTVTGKEGIDPPCNAFTAPTIEE